MKKFLMSVILIMGINLSTFAAFGAVNNHVNLPEGHNFSIGLFGLSYDYSISNFGIGTYISTGSPIYINQARAILGVRGYYRFFEVDNLFTGIIGGITFDSGNPYNEQRGKFIPDLGLGVAYKFGDTGFNVRLNLTFTSMYNYNAFQSYPSIDTENTVTPNFLQALTIGPNTSLEIAYSLNNQSEITLGGGSLIGLRINF